MPRLVVLPALILCCGTVAAQSPPSIDSTIDRIAKLRADRAELEKQEAAAVGDLKAQLKALNDKIDKLGLVDPPKPPPVPVPPTPPPAPVDPLKAKLKTAYEADPAKEAKREQALDLAALYKQVAVLAQDRTVLTSGDLLAQKKKAAARLIGADALKAVRVVVSAEIGLIMPTDGPLSDELRAAAAALFLKLAACIEEIASK